MFFWKRQSLHTSSFSLLIKRRPACCKFSRIYAGIFLCFEFFGLPKNDVAFLDRFEKIRVVSQWFLWEIRGREACMSRLHRPGSPFVKNIIRTNNRQARGVSVFYQTCFWEFGLKDAIKKFYEFPQMHTVTWFTELLASSSDSSTLLSCQNLISFPQFSLVLLDLDAEAAAKWTARSLRRKETFWGGGTRWH